MGYDKKYLGELLKRVYASTREGIVHNNEYRRAKVLGGSGTRIRISGANNAFEGVVPEGQGPTLTIVDDGVDAINEFVFELLKDPEFRDIVGREAIENELGGLLRSTVGVLPTDDLSSIVRFQIIKPLRDGIRDWQTYIPVVNLVTRERLILGNVEFIDAQESRNAIGEFISEHQFAGDGEEKQKQRQAISQKIDLTCQQCQSFARVTLRAHEKRVQSVASDIALIAVNVLRAHTHLFYSHEQRALIGLPIELPSGVWETISLGTDEDRKVQLNSGLFGPHLKFVLDSRMIEHLKNECHFGVVQDILGKTGANRNSFESAVVQAYQSLGRAIVAPTVDMRFLGCAIALERMLIIDGEETTTERWSDSLAITVEPDVSRREATIKRAKQLYDLRSRIVHAAFSGIPDEDALLMEQWAQHVIFVALSGCQGYSSHRDFCNTIDPRKIGLGKTEKSN